MEKTRSIEKVHSAETSMEENPMEENSMKEADSADRLAAFEKMLTAVQKEYNDILEKMERLKAEGKVKTVTYQQLMSRKLMYQNMMSLYQIYGLT